MNYVTTLATKVKVEIRMSRTRGKKTNTTNINSIEQEEYYKVSVFITFLDNLMSQLHSKFDK